MWSCGRFQTSMRPASAHTYKQETVLLGSSKVYFALGTLLHVVRLSRNYKGVKKIQISDPFLCIIFSSRLSNLEYDICPIEFESFGPSPYLPLWAWCMVWERFRTEFGRTLSMQAYLPHYAESYTYKAQYIHATVMLFYIPQKNCFGRGFVFLKVHHHTM